jgi:hypothetical protein
MADPQGAVISNQPREEFSYNGPPFTNEERMILIEGELRRALEIKEAVANDPGLEPLSDFMYAQYAIIALTYFVDLDTVLKQIRRVQCLRDEYGIVECHSHAQETVTRLILEVIPGHHLAFQFGYNSYEHAVDLTNFNAAHVLSDPEKTRIWMAGEYYLMHAAYSDFESIRQGSIKMFECEGYDWRSSEMLNMACMEKLGSELLASYPAHFRALKHYHTNNFVNMALSMMKRILPEHIYEYFILDCRVVDDGSVGLPDHYCEFGLEESDELLLAELEDALRTRYDNDSAFVLDERALHVATRI